MAKAGQIAGLAALGALAYMNRDKLGFGDDSTGPAATASENAASQARTEAQRNAVSGNTGAEPPRRQMSDYMAQAPQDPREAGSESSSPSSQIFSNQVGKSQNNRTKLFNGNAPSNASSNASSNTPKNDVYVANTTANAYPTMPGGFSGQDLPAKNVEDAGRNVSKARAVANAAQKDANKSGTEKKYSEATDKYRNLSRAMAVEDARKREAEQARIIKLHAASGGRRAAGGAIKTTKMASGGMTSSASRRADGIATKGKTRGKIC